MNTSPHISQLDRDVIEGIGLAEVEERTYELHGGVSAPVCPRHRHCAYTGTEPGLCPTCHATTAKCGGLHGQAPSDGSWLRGRAAGKTHGTLRPGQALHPGEVGLSKLSVRQRPQHPLRESHADLALAEGDRVRTGDSAEHVEAVAPT